MKQAFLPCPSCGGNRLFLTKYEVSLKILKDRSWLVCKDCDFQIPTEKYKKSLFSMLSYIIPGGPISPKSSILNSNLNSLLFSKQTD